MHIYAKCYIAQLIKMVALSCQRNKVMHIYIFPFSLSCKELTYLSCPPLHALILPTNHQSGAKQLFFFPQKAMNPMDMIKTRVMNMKVETSGNVSFPRVLDGGVERHVTRVIVTFGAIYKCLVSGMSPICSLEGHWHKQESRFLKIHLFFPPSLKHLSKNKKAPSFQMLYQRSK